MFLNFTAADASKTKVKPVDFAPEGARPQAVDAECLIFLLFLCKSVGWVTRNVLPPSLRIILVQNVFVVDSLAIDPLHGVTFAVPENKVR